MVTFVVAVAGHSNTVNSVVWTGDHMLISGSNDREIRVWNADTGRTIRVLTGHAHWVNKLALSTASVLRTGQFDHHGKGPRDPEAAQQVFVLLFGCIYSSSRALSVPLPQPLFTDECHVLHAKDCRRLCATSLSCCCAL